MLENLFGTLVQLTCCNCGTRFAMDRGLYDTRQADQKIFHCPNGHPQHFSENETSKLRKELEQQKKQTEFYSKRSSENYEEAQRERRRRYAVKGQLTKIKKRVHNGVCPCCNRFFANLHRHMTGQHPDFVKREE